MINFFMGLNPLYQTILASLFALLCTILGSLIIIFIKSTSKKIINIMLTISAGIMLGAAFFSLLLPSLSSSIIKPLIGVISGITFLIIGDIIARKKTTTKSSNCILLVISIILHNIPEGIAIGVAFGSCHLDSDILLALSLTLAISIQNIPEGTAISVPLMNYGLSKKRSIIIGILSGIVEPISAIAGYYLVTKITFILPIMLSFAAGAMFYVIVSDLIPESINNENKNMMTSLFMLGFIIMMLLEVLL